MNSNIHNPKGLFILYINEFNMVLYRTELKTLYTTYIQCIQHIYTKSNN